jgi:GDP/UDP-N,N'-diacetylbacillosamine 2-epimerase (hydrolysing)
MAHLHFVATDEYKRRVIQLGEQPENVFVAGGLGVDSIKRVQLLEREALETALDLKFGLRSLLVTFHPVTLENTAVNQMQELLAALNDLHDTTLVFTLPNADTDGRRLIRMVEQFVSTHPNSRAYHSLGQLRYLSCLAQVDAVIGNSSSGLLEMPSFKKGTINIGDRQSGRPKAASVIDCDPTQEAIQSSLTRLYSPAFQSSLQNVKNPYGEGGASKTIIETIKRLPLAGLIKKSFFDLPATSTASGLK